MWVIVMQLQPLLDTMVRALPFWENLNQQERDLVSVRASVLRYAPGQLVRSSNDECLGFLYLDSGSLRAYLLSPEGREVTLYRMEAGEYCVLSAACVLDAISFDTEIVAEADCEALLVPADVFATLLKHNICVERDAYRLATERFSDVVAGMERMVFFNLEQRVASFLLDEAAAKGTDRLALTQEQIAVNIASAREVVSRTLKTMAEKGFVALFRGGVEIKDKPRLYQLIGQ